MNRKKHYQSPELTIDRFDVEDIITASGDTWLTNLKTALTAGDDPEKKYDFSDGVDWNSI